MTKVFFSICFKNLCYGAFFLSNYHTVEIMERALDEAAFAPEVDAVLRPFFAQTATFLINRWE